VNFSKAILIVKIKTQGELMSNKFSLAKILLRIGLVGIITATLFSGCSTKIPTERKVGTLNLQSDKLTHQSQVKNVIAIVSPNIAANSAVAQTQNQASQSPIAMMMMQRMGSMNINYDFNSAFSHSYAKRLNKALESSVSEIISAKGFKLKGPYGVFDDMTYQDKKKVYLAFVPKVDFTIENKVLKSKRSDLHSHTEGVIQIGGSVTVSMLEPMTGQVFVKRRINLSDFNIQEPYIYEKQTSIGGNGGIVGTLLEKGTAPDKLLDTTDVALTKAINKFYSKTVAKINSYLDKEEILSFEKDILKLKGLKRF
jgi:neuraminyllactose-binding hemagglutinin